MRDDGPGLGGEKRGCRNEDGTSSLRLCVCVGSGSGLLLSILRVTGEPGRLFRLSSLMLLGRGEGTRLLESLSGTGGASSSGIGALIKGRVGSMNSREGSGGGDVGVEPPLFCTEGPCLGELCAETESCRLLLAGSDGG